MPDGNSKNTVFQKEKQVFQSEIYLFQNEIYLFQNEIQRSQNGATIPLGNTLGNTLENSIKERPRIYIRARAPESVINFGRRLIEPLVSTGKTASTKKCPNQSLTRQCFFNHMKNRYSRQKHTWNQKVVSSHSFKCGKHAKNARL